MSVWGRIILLHFFIIVNPHRRNSSTPAGVLTSIDSKEIIGSVLKPSCKPILLSTQFHKSI